MSSLYSHLSSSQDPIELNRELETWGRKIIVPESTKRVAKFSFHDLCGKPMSAADYIKVSWSKTHSLHENIYIELLPRSPKPSTPYSSWMYPRWVLKARTWHGGSSPSSTVCLFTFSCYLSSDDRLACYESKTKLFVTSEVPIYQVFSDEGQTASDQLQRTMEEMVSKPPDRRKGWMAHENA